MTSRLRRRHERNDAQPHQRPGEVAGADPTDEPGYLLAQLAGLERYVNAQAGQLPGVAVVMARQVTDVLRAVLTSAQEGAALDIHAIVSIKSVLGDYLPTTLHRYLALDVSGREAPRPSGRTPRQSLDQQLQTLYASVEDLAAAVRAQDADALLSHGAFLRTKFTASDLDL